MKTVASIMHAIGYGGNGLLFLYIETVGILRNPINLINPLYHLQVIIALLTTPLFWLLLLVTLAGVGVAALSEKGSASP